MSINVSIAKVVVAIALMVLVFFLGDFLRKCNTQSVANKVFDEIEAGAMRIPDTKDGWGRPLLINIHSTNTVTAYCGRSSGRDGEFGTSDDIFVRRSSTRRPQIIEHNHE